MPDEEDLRNLGTEENSINTKCVNQTVSAFTASASFHIPQSLESKSENKLALTPRLHISEHTFMIQHTEYINAFLNSQGCYKVTFHFEGNIHVTRRIIGRL